MKKHYVIFYSPGTFVAETSQKEIKSWNVDDAIKMADNIIERYNAKPYGFQFITKERLDSDFDSKEIDRSNMYYLGGDVLTVDDLMAENDPSNDILIRNMQSNGWDKIVRNKNSYSWCQPLKDGDVVLNILNVTLQEDK